MGVQEVPRQGPVGRAQGFQVVVGDVSLEKRTNLTERRMGGKKKELEIGTNQLRQQTA